MTKQYLSSPSTCTCMYIYKQIALYLLGKGVDRVVCVCVWGVCVCGGGGQSACLKHAEVQSLTYSGHHSSRHSSTGVERY